MEIQKEEFGNIPRNNNLREAVDYKQLRYVRYGDNFLIGVLGSKEDSLIIRDKVVKFVFEKLKLNLDKMTPTKSAMFLETLIRITHKKQVTSVQLVVPIERLVDRLTMRGLCRNGGQPTRWTKMIKFDSAYIVKFMSQIWVQITTYYYFEDLNRIYYIIKYSCMLTLVSKYKLGTLKKGFKKFGKNIEIKDKEGKVLASFPFKS
jgi:hypothetical protein